MAKLLAYYSLCPINDVGEFLGLSRDVHAGCVINTLGRNIVQVVKLSNQKLQHSWTSLERLTSKVVYDFRSERYVGVFDGRYIRCWASDQVDINKVKKVKFFRNILELFTLENGQVLVLYDDGSCESLESAVDTRNKDRKNPDDVMKNSNVDPKRQAIQEVKITSLEDGEIMLVYFVKDIESGTIELNYTLLTKDSLISDKEFRKIKLERMQQNVQLVGQCIVEGSGYPSLITIWTDKRIFSQTLTYEVDSSLELQPKTIGNYISILSIINANEPLSLIGISKDYIAVYANNLNQEGATLLLYNVQFKAVQAKQFFKVYFNKSHFWMSENHILLAFGQTLAVVPFVISKEQLSDMVGTQRSFELQNYVDNESINEDFDLNEGYTFAGHLQWIMNDEDCKSQHQEQRKAFKIFENLENFEQTLQTVYKDDIKVDVAPDDNLPDDIIQMRLMNNTDDSIGPLIFSEQFEIVAGELEKRGFCEMEITSKLLPLMIQANASLDIGRCLKRYNNISERALVSALNYALGCINQRSSVTKIPEIGELLKKHPETALPISKPSEQLPNMNVLAEHDVSDRSANDLVNIVLACNFSRPIIMPIVRKEINLNNVLRLLDHLLILLTDPVARLRKIPANSDTFDSDTKVIEWANLLIDSNYQKLILSHDKAVKERLINWMNVIKIHTESLKELKGLAPSIKRLVERKNGGNERHYNRWYNIETVQLY
ncbi:nucleolar protein 11-like [Toxorhynchites rutilus septentrionalis]|uniref:nucleolar protein 11-like n=1 Tax=Toxorhynchites rutilus septentrionalis TaxID=329112 RepID=UPI00247A7C9C|nr:nucleolar protein 11-like [Toxorhynchites rutilus septentrionalis]